MDTGYYIQEGEIFGPKAESQCDDVDRFMACWFAFNVLYNIFLANGERAAIGDFVFAGESRGSRRSGGTVRLDADDREAPPGAAGGPGTYKSRPGLASLPVVAARPGGPVRRGGATHAASAAGPGAAASDFAGDWRTATVRDTLAREGRSPVASRQIPYPTHWEARNAMNGDTATVRTVHELRRRWKPHKERLLARGGEQPTSIRFHRACSWLARAEQMPEGQDHDLALISLWIAFNALYGQWDSCKREPRPDRESWRSFVDRILGLDRQGHVVSFFWQEPCAKRSGQSRKAAYNAQTWYIEERWAKVLDEVLDRVHLMRCQLVHGAATYGGKLNRTSLRHCVTMMQRLLPALLLVWIDHGADEDWGPMCYPPVKTRGGPAPDAAGRPRSPR